MRISTVLPTVAILSGCAGAPVSQGGRSQEDLVLATAIDEPIPVVTVALEPGLPEPELVCREVTRPGSRIVVDEVCVPIDETGINTATREHIQREVSGQGWSPGWKTEEQIQAERSISLGIPQAAP